MNTYTFVINTISHCVYCYVNGDQKDIVAASIRQYNPNKCEPNFGLMDCDVKLAEIKAMFN